MNDLEKNSEKFLTGKGSGMRFNQGKLRYDLVHPKAMEDFVQVLTDGAEKYKPRNWENGLSWTSVLASLKRHISEIEKGEDYDKDSGRLHISHAACNVHFINAFYHDFPQGDDRPKKFLHYPRIGLDIDEVIADFTGAWYKMYPDVQHHPTSWSYDRKMTERFNVMREENKLDEFYLNIEPLIKPEELVFEPECYITSRPVSKEITEKWLDNNGFPTRPVYSVDVKESKVKVARDSNIEIFIEDSFTNFVDLNKNGIFTFLLTKPHNIKYNVGHHRINTINDLPFFK